MGPSKPINCLPQHPWGVMSEVGLARGSLREAGALPSWVRAPGELGWSWDWDGGLSSLTRKGICRGKATMATGVLTSPTPCPVPKGEGSSERANPQFEVM